MKERLGVLDGLRGIGILQVLWVHLRLGGMPSAPLSWLELITQTGRFGVHLLFFISGFLIVYPFVRAHHAGEREPAWISFAWRRFIKVVPSYVLSIAVAYAIGFAACERTHSTVFQELITHALFIHTWWAETAVSVNGVLWTLGIEVEFYAIFPLLWWCFKRRPRLTGFGLIAVAWALRMWPERYFPDATAALPRNLPNYIDLFAYGMLCAWCFVRFRERLRYGRGRYVMPIVAIAGAAIMALTFIAEYEEVAWLPRVALHEILGIAFSLLAFGALCSPREWMIPLSNPLLRFFAIISYNLYLWNWMIIHEVQLLRLPPAAFTMTAFFVSIAVAVLLTYGLERPLLRLPDPDQHPHDVCKNMASLSQSG